MNWCRWQAAAADLSGHLELLVGDVLLAAAAVNYLGPFTGAHSVQQQLGSLITCRLLAEGLESSICPL